LDHLVVLGGLLLWVVVGPALFDDGWVLATVRNFNDSGVFSSYFDTKNAVLPLGYVHDAIVHLFFQASNSFWSLRLPSLLAGLGTWLVCRSVLNAVTSRFADGRTLVIRMTAAALFLLSWISWNTTLRPEPLIAFLVSISLLAAVKWHAGSNPIFVLIGLVSTALALSMGASGVVSIAPWILLSPRLVSSMVRDRNALPLLVASVLIGSTVLLLAVLSSGDVEFWSAAREAFQAEEHHSAGFLDEPIRYVGLFRYSNPVRQLAVLLPLVAPLMFLVRRKTASRSQADLPVLSFLIAVLLLSITPSKWIWHFGAMAPLVTVAVSWEAGRWRSSKALIALGGASVVAAYLSLITVLVWNGWFGWNLMALGELDDLGGTLLRGEVPTPAFLAATAVTGFALLSTISGSRKGMSVPGILHRYSQQVVPASAFVAVGVAMLVFLVDGLYLSPDWSPLRQNLAQLEGRTCGAAEQVLVHFGHRTALPMVHGLQTAVTLHNQLNNSLDIRRVETSIALPGESSEFNIGTWELAGGAENRAWFVSPWFGLEGLSARHREGVLIQLKGDSALEGNEVLIQVAHETASQFQIGPLIEMGSPTDSSWRPLSIGLHLASPSASAVRVIAIAGAAKSFAFSEPYVHQSHSSLDRVVGSLDGRVLIAPQIGMYFPCFEQPRLTGGQAEIPTLVLSAGGWPLGLPGSPYSHLSDVADLNPLPITWRSRTEGPLFEVILVEPKTGER
jgi:hypothetical protein